MDGNEEIEIVLLPLNVHDVIYFDRWCQMQNYTQLYVPVVKMNWERTHLIYEFLFNK